MGSTKDKLVQLVLSLLLVCAIKRISNRETKNPRCVGLELRKERVERDRRLAGKTNKSIK